MTPPRYHAQCGEDIWIQDNLKPEPGFFVEVGAFDGIQSSNTLAFEDMGWSGYLIEADPFLAARAQSNRMSPTLCCAVGTHLQILPFFVNLPDRGLSSLSPELSGKIIPVPVLSLDLICQHSKITKIDLLSIDTEGTELDVWYSLTDIRPRVVIVEHQTRDKPSKEEEIIKHLDSDSYKLVHKTTYNLIFVPK